MKRLVTVFFAIFFLGLSSLISCKTDDGKSLSNIDLNNPDRGSRDQYPLGTCASFGIMAMLETELFLQRGITIDLSERYYARSTMSFLGAFTTTRYAPEILDRYGVIPGRIYPCKEFGNHDSFRREIDILKSIPSEEKYYRGLSLENTMGIIKKLSIDRRFEFLGGSSFFGEIPRERQSTSVVGIPAQAKKIIDPTQVPEIDGIPCFSEGASTAQGWITPVTFLKQCIGFKKENYTVKGATKSKLFSADLASITNRLKYGFPVVISTAWEQQRSAFLAEENQPGYLEFYPTKDPEIGVIGGHVVLITGYLSKKTFLDPKMHHKGWLATDMFERLNLLWDLSTRNIRERLYGRLYEGDNLLSRQKRLEIGQHLDARTKFIESLWKEHRALKDQEKKIDMNSEFERNRFRKNYQAYKKRVDQLRLIESKIRTIRLSGLSSQKRAEVAKRFILIDDSLDRSDPEFRSEYPFEIKESEDGKSIHAVFKRIPEWVLKTTSSYRKDESATERLTRRRKTRLGQLLDQEHGLFISRNSWGIHGNAGVSGSYLVGFNYAQKNITSTVYRLPSASDTKVKVDTKDLPEFNSGKRYGAQCYQDTSFISFSSYKTQCIKCCDRAKSPTVTFKKGCYSACSGDFI